MLHQLKQCLILIILLGVLLSGCGTVHTTESNLTPHYSPIVDGTIEYYQLGKGSPIVLIPGYATDVSSWSDEFLKELAKHHQLIVLNNRNVAGSIIHSERYTSADSANDVGQLIRNLHLKNPAVLGISMGGMIAQQVAVLHPNDVGQLILINTAISGSKSVHPSMGIERKMLNIPQNKLSFYLLAVDSFFPSSWKPRMAVKLVTGRFQTKHSKEINLKKIIPYQKKFLMDWGQDEVTAQKIRQLSIPVLILNGSADIIIPPINSTILARAIPHAKLVRWQDGGHAMIYQYPKQMAYSINGFLGNVHGITSATSIPSCRHLDAIRSSKKLDGQ
jgi:pimeloyl-ACP methyl ester carboxylesterase